MSDKRIIKAVCPAVKKNVGCAGKTYVLESKQALPYGRRLVPQKGAMLVTLYDFLSIVFLVTICIVALR